MNVYTKNQIWCVIVWAMTFIGAFVVVYFLTSCKVDYSALAAHKESCVKSGNVVIEKSKADEEPCWVTEDRLSRLVKTDPDCLAYWGDAGVELCGGNDGGH